MFDSNNYKINNKREFMVMTFEKEIKEKVLKKCHKWMSDEDVIDLTIQECRKRVEEAKKKCTFEIYLDGEYIEIIGKEQFEKELDK